MVANFPFRDPVLHHVQVADMTKMAISMWDDVMFFGDKFPNFVTKKGEETTDKLHQQFYVILFYFGF